MSYSILEAKDARKMDVLNAIQTRDSEALYRLARLFKIEEDDETALTLLKQAQQIDKDDMAFDQERDNNLN